VNASPNLYADLEVDSESMVVALDGMPLTYHDPTRHTELRHVLPGLVSFPKRKPTLVSIT
jgi:hypothetical protein